MNYSEELEREDYLETHGPASSPVTAANIPVGRILEKLDEHLSHKDFRVAETHLCYWLNEADGCGDDRGKLTVLNELIGFYRKTENKKDGLETVKKALVFIDKLGIDDTVSAGTTYLNAATAYKSFDMDSEALSLYEKAKIIYEKQLFPGDERLAGLYNNMAITLTALKYFNDARALFEKALSIISAVGNGETDEAITHCNLADLAAAEFGIEKGESLINQHLDRAFDLLNTHGLPRDSYYAYVCEKCAPTFGFYGQFFREKELIKRAGELN